MSLKQIVDIRQTQAMNAELVESISLLQYSTQDLNLYISSKLDDNPFLNSSNDESLFSDDIGDKIDTNDGENYVSNALYDSNEQIDYGKKSPSFDNNQVIRARKSSLRDHLLAQINIDITNYQERIIAINLLDYLDDSGYLTNSNIISALQTNMVEVVIAKLQQLDPPGVFARSLSECIKLQLMDRAIYDDTFALLISNLQLIAEADFKSLSKKCCINIDEIKRRLNIIKTLNPKPGASFAKENVEIVRPDIFLTIVNDNCVIEINKNAAIKVTVDSNYYQLLKNRKCAKNSCKYLTHQYGKANWLVKAIANRNATLIKVATVIVARQKAFFTNGISHLVPLSLKEIAEESGYSTSTVSRITTAKYLSTPLGIFELKYFFSSNVLSNNETEQISNKKIKYAIKKIIDKENSTQTYSDNKIVEILRKESMLISRRTVAKYRDKMNIPSSSVRRKQNKLNEIIA